ncbi:hypothetical protein GALMADRAFT_273556 [Galerina marginata CBS 339.88]|uniref:DUF6533 domain-containing protein n=1 Tax=Galerina marginata (strain CBS 339.88) TaxID=685588 RepID=A0A067SI92_GALM3|nr:hypothetical protein GALMADRAFT_273556 [Galerina marginata CBS 339.88]
MDHLPGPPPASIIWDTYVVSYVWFSGLTILTYDTILTFPREVTYIWRRKRSFPTILYLILRYWGLVVAVLCTCVYSTVQTSVSVCRLFFGFAALVGTNTTLLTIVNAILGLRLYALYGKSFLVLCVLFVLFLGEFAVQVYVGVKIGISTVKGAFVPPPGLPILGCLTSPPDLSGARIAWAVSIFVSLVCFSMTTIKFILSTQEAQQTGWRQRASWRVQLSPIAKAFVRDGAVYFLAVLATLIAGTINSSVARGPNTVMYQPFMTASLVVAGSRMVLNLREVAAIGFSDSVDTSVTTDRIQTTIGFQDSRTI